MKMKVSGKLTEWYSTHLRDLPWRSTRDPYAIWLSEIILQQTRVAQGLPYWQRFMTHYPTVQDLANASEQEVLKLWQGLGYYSRGRNLRHAAIQVVEEFDGQFPQTYQQLKSLKGVGDYTAAAIASFAFDLPHAVLDGNVFRVLSRLHDESTPIDSTLGKKLFQALADELLPAKNFGEHNQAMMELGATVCTPKKPKCTECPLQEDCLSLRNNTIEFRPIKSKKIKRRTRHFHYMLVEDTEKVAVRRRNKGDIWEGLYEFPCLESENPPKKVSQNLLSQPIKHVLTHQDIHAHLYKAVSSDVISDMEIEWVTKNEIHTLPLSRLMEKLLAAVDL